MVRVILTTDVYHPFVCGVTKIVDIFAKEIPRYGYRVSILAPAQMKEAYIYSRTDSVDRLYLKSLKFLAFYPEVNAPEIFSSFFAIRKLLNNGINGEKVLVHAHTPYLTTTLLRLTARMMKIKVPIILTYHTLVDEYLKRRFGFLRGVASMIDSVFMGDLLRKIKALIVPTEYAKKALLRHLFKGFRKLETKFIKIPNPLSREDYVVTNKSASSYYDDLEDGKYAIWVGRISHEKNIQFLIKLFENLDYKLVIVGKGPLLKYFKRKASSNTLFTGFVNNDVLRALLRSARCFVIASGFDNMPLAVMEAMAQGTPIISYNKGGHTEYIKHGVNGYIYRNIKEAKKYIKNVFENDDIYEEMSMHARETSKKFHPDIIIPKHTRVYENFIS